MEKLELVVKDEQGSLVLSQQVEDILDLCDGQLSKAQEQYEIVKKAIIDAMLDNNIKTSTVGKYKLSVREPKEKWNFDAERFVKEENPEIVIAFVKKEVVKSESFDMEKLKTEYPEVYAKCLKKEEHEEYVVDEHKLWDSLRNIWEKYATKEEPKPATITIKKVGE